MGGWRWIDVFCCSFFEKLVLGGVIFFIIWFFGNLRRFRNLMRLVLSICFIDLYSTLFFFWGELKWKALVFLVLCLILACYFYYCLLVERMFRGVIVTFILYFMLEGYGVWVVCVIFFYVLSYGLCLYRLFVLCLVCFFLLLVEREVYKFFFF